MFIVAVDMALSGWPLFVVEVFPGHWQLNACSTPKRVNSRPCERNQTKLESTCCLLFIWCAIGFSWARQEKREVFRKRKRGDRRLAEHRMVPSRRCNSD